MATEIERKFLVDEKVIDRVRGNFDSITHIEQAYVVVGDVEVRVRSKVKLGSPDDFVLTVKSGSGLTRTEVETSIESDQFYDLWYTSTWRIRKDRYQIGRLELDVFRDRLFSLVLLEIELKDENETLPVVPAWLNSLVIKEVTDDSRYKNQALAVSGLPY